VEGECAVHEAEVTRRGKDHALYVDTPTLERYMDRPGLDGALWAKRETPADPFKE